jgi:hypothetical protein
MWLEAMRAFLLLSRAVVSCLLPVPGLAGAAEASGGKSLGQLYDRIAADLASGRPLVATVFVALCDNDSQGIVKVRNRRICRGDDPEQNLYWATAGGLSATLRAAGWRRVFLERFTTGDLAVKAIWRKRLRPGGALRARGIVAGVDAYIVGLGYRGREIRKAMIDYLQAVNRDEARLEDAAEVRLQAGGQSQIVGYIGHDYFYDVEDPRPLLSLRDGDSVLHKGVFALSCTGHRLIRPAIRRGNAHILMLNRTLGFPGAWTAEAIVVAIAHGSDARAIHRHAAAAFARGQGVSLSTAWAAFAHGD